MALATNEMDIITARLHIRDLIEEDAEPLNRLRCDQAVTRYISSFGAETLEETQRWIIATKFYNERPERDSHNCSILLRVTGEVIGWIGFGFSDPEQKPVGSVGIGYAIRPQFWGQGYTTEALQATLDFIFRETAAESARAYCIVDNVASARVMQKAGMRYVGRFANPDEPAANSEIDRYALSREMWEKDYAL